MIEDYYDDWLMVTLNIQSLAGKSVTLVSPCLMTLELIQMKEWFQSLLEGESPGMDLYFTEIEMEYKYIGDKTVQIRLSSSFYSGLIMPEYSADHTTVFEFCLDSDSLYSIIDSLEKMTRQYPQRATHYSL